MGCKARLYEVLCSLLTESRRFRWVACQLDALRRSFPASIRDVLNGIPKSLDETYERALLSIDDEKRPYARRLFQCLTASTRTLCLDELAEVLAFRFNSDSLPTYNVQWRPADAKEAVLSACSSLIIVSDVNGAKAVRYSHFSVKDFLTSDRLAWAEERLSYYHILPRSAHTTLAHIGLSMLLHLDDKITKDNIQHFPLAPYAIQNWFLHARYKDVASSIPHATERFFFDVLADQPWEPEATPLYYAALCGLCGLANYLISESTLGGDVHTKCGVHGTPLHAASWNGRLDAVSLLLDHGADVNLKNEHGRTPLCEAYYGRHLEVMQLLIDRGATVDVQYDDIGLLTHDASYMGEAEVIRLLLQHNADVNATSYQNYTPLHWASSVGHANVVQVLLEHGADINALSDFGTPLYRASVEGHFEVTKLLLGRGADGHIRAPCSETPFQVATRKGHTQVALLLLEYGAGIPGKEYSTAAVQTMDPDYRTVAVQAMTPNSE